MQNRIDPFNQGFIDYGHDSDSTLSSVSREEEGERERERARRRIHAMRGQIVFHVRAIPTLLSPT